MAWVTLPSVVAAWLLPQFAVPAVGGALLGGLVLACVAIWCAWGVTPASVALLGLWIAVRGGWTLDDQLVPSLDGTDVMVEGTLCDFARPDDRATRFAFDLEPASAGQGLPDRLYVSWFDAPSEPQPGETWRLRVRLRSPGGSANPGAFDFEEWLFRSGIGGTAWVRPSKLNARLRQDAAACPVAAWRGSLARRIEATLGKRPATPYVLGMVVGATRGLTAADWDLMRRTGTTHLLAISGINIAMVAVPVLAFGRVLARIVPAIALRHPHGLGVIPGLLLAALYTALAGYAVSTVRALLMLAAGIGYLLVGRRAAPLDLLLAAALGILVVDPFQIRLAGFWLSFLAVACLLLGPVRPPRVPAGVTGPRRLMLALLAGIVELLKVQVVLGLVLAPVTMGWFGQVSLVAPLANLLAVPVFSILLPLSLVGTALLGVFPAAAGQLLGAAAWILERGLTGLGKLGAADSAVLPVPAATPADLALFAAGALILLWRRPWPCRWLGVLCLLPVLAGSRLSLPAGFLRVIVLDVGQGLSVIVQTRAHVLVYDAGPAFAGRDAGSAIVVPVLRNLHVPQVDRLVISHNDMDHRGGAASILAAWPAAVVDASEPTGLPARTAQICHAGLGWQWDGVDFRMLSPPGPDDGLSSRNDRSCVLAIRAPGAAILLPGDISARREREIGRRSVLFPADLVVAAHHGSRTSSDPQLVAGTGARYAVFSTGYRNRWHFPSPAVVRRWEVAGACVLDTARTGALVFEVRAGALALVSRERLDHPHLWTTRQSPDDRCHIPVTAQ